MPRIRKTPITVDQFKQACKAWILGEKPLSPFHHNILMGPSEKVKKYHNQSISGSFVKFCEAFNMFANFSNVIFGCYNEKNYNKQFLLSDSELENSTTLRWAFNQLFQGDMTKILISRAEIQEQQKAEQQKAEQQKAEQQKAEQQRREAEEARERKAAAQRREEEEKEKKGKEEKEEKSSVAGSGSGTHARSDAVAKILEQFPYSQFLLSDKDCLPLWVRAVLIKMTLVEDGAEANPSSQKTEETKAINKTVSSLLYAIYKIFYETFNAVDRKKELLRCFIEFGMNAFAGIGVQKIKESGNPVAFAHIDQDMEGVVLSIEGANEFIKKQPDAACIILLILINLLKVFRDRQESFLGVPPSAINEYITAVESLQKKINIDPSNGSHMELPRTLSGFRK